MEAIGDLLQQEIARVVSQRVVDFLEAVEIEQEKRHGTAFVFGPPQRSFDTLFQQVAVGQVGQRVVGRLVSQQLLLGLALGDVSQECHSAVNALGHHRRDRHFDGEAGAGRAPGRRLGRGREAVDGIGRFGAACIDSHQLADVAPDRLRLAVAEHHLGGPVERLDGSVVAKRQHRVEAVLDDVVHQDLGAADLLTLEEQSQRLLVDAAGQPETVTTHERGQPR